MRLVRLVVCGVVLVSSSGCARDGSRWNNLPASDLTAGDSATQDAGLDQTGTPDQVGPQDLSQLDSDATSQDVHDTAETSTQPDVTDSQGPSDMLELADGTDASDQVDALDIQETGPDLAEPDTTPEVVEIVPTQPVVLDSWGGFADKPLAQGTGFFAVAQDDGRMWLVDPDGNAFFSVAIQSVTFGSLAAPTLGYAPGTLTQKATWADATLSTSDPSTAVNAEHLDTMLANGFNSVGAWNNGVASHATGKIPYTLSFSFTGGVTSQVSTPIPKVNEGGFPDVFHPDFAAACQEYANKVISETMIQDPWNLGYYLDNELKWWGGIQILPTGLFTLADDFADELPETPAKQAFTQFMDERYAGDIGALNLVYGTQFQSFQELAAASGLPYDNQNTAHVADRNDFIERIADAYFSAASAALKARDPNHLNLCARFASIAPPGAIRQAAHYCDVVTFNDYYLRSDPISNMALGGLPEERWAQHASLIWQGAGGPKPVILTEWGIRAKDTGLPNSFGAGYVVNGQADRAQFYHQVLTWLLEREHEGVNFFVGAHWFMYMDEPPTGRFDGEDSNYGVVSIRDEKYALTLEGMQAANAALKSHLVFGQAPTLLPLAANVKAKVLEGTGTAELTWQAVPGALGYRILALSHPAGLENRIWESWIVPAVTSTTVPLQGYGAGWIWLGVQPLHPDAPAVGTRVSGAVATSPLDSSLPGLQEVLACEWLDTVSYPNRYLDQGAGPGYARLIPSFDADQGMALGLEFVPYSRTWVKGVASGQYIQIDVRLPQPVQLGNQLLFRFRPHYMLTPGSQWRPSSDFVVVQVLGTQGEVLQEIPLSGLSASPMVPQAAVLPLSATGQAAGLRFRVDIFQADLPLEQPVKLDIDQIEFVL